MRAIVGFLVLLTMGITILFLAKNKNLILRVSRFTKSPERAVIALTTGGAAVIVLSLVCLAAFAAWSFGLIG